MLQSSHGKIQFYQYKEKEIPCAKGKYQALATYQTH